MGGQRRGGYLRLRPLARVVAVHAAHGQWKQHHRNADVIGIDKQFSACVDRIE